VAPNLDGRWRVEALTQERSRILERLLGYAHVVVACHRGGEGIWRAALTVVRWIKAAQRCIGAAAPRGAVIDLEQGRISRLAAGYRDKPLTPPAGPTRTGRDRMRLRHLWAKHPAIIDDSRPSRPGCLFLCQPVSLRGCADPVSGTRFTTAPGTQKALSRWEKALTCGN
jgi:hypothetical protein